MFVKRLSLTMHDCEVQRSGVFALWVGAVEVNVGAPQQLQHQRQAAIVDGGVQGRVASVRRVVHVHGGLHLKQAPTLKQRVISLLLAPCKSQVPSLPISGICSLRITE